MAGQAEYEQLAICTRDFRFYSFQALGGGHSITDMLKMISHILNLSRCPMLESRGTVRVATL